MNSVTRCASKQVEKYLLFVSIFPELSHTVTAGSTDLERHLFPCWTPPTAHALARPGSSVLGVRPAMPAFTSSQGPVCSTPNPAAGAMGQCGRHRMTGRATVSPPPPAAPSLTHQPRPARWPPPVLPAWQKGWAPRRRSWFNPNMKGGRTFLLPCKWNKVFPVLVLQRLLLQVWKQAFSVKGARGRLCGLVLLPKSSWKQGVLWRCVEEKVVCKGYDAISYSFPRYLIYFFKVELLFACFFI